MSQRVTSLNWITSFLKEIYQLKDEEKGRRNILVKGEKKRGHRYFFKKTQKDWGRKKREYWEEQEKRKERDTQREKED